MRKYYSMPSSNGWFVRGGNYSDGVYTGILYFTGNVPYSISGAASANVGARAVLLLLDYNIVPKGNFSIYKFKDLYHK